MTEFQSMTARELRAEAPKHGIHGASRMSKEQIIAKLQAAPKPRGLFDANGTFSRDRRDALRRSPVTLYDPAADVTSTERKRGLGLNRHDRRHRGVREHGKVVRYVQVPKRFRKDGAQRPVTLFELATARAAL